MPSPSRKRSPRQKCGPKASSPRAIALTSPPDAPAAFFEHVFALTNRRGEVRSLLADKVAALEPVRPAATALNAKLKREAYLNVLHTWHDAAKARLEDLRAGRTGSGPTAQPIAPDQQPQRNDLMRRLIVGLSKNAALISTLEGAQQRWHTAAKAAREGIQLRTDTARELLGNPFRPDAQLHLKVAHATFMLEGNSPRIRKELKEAAAQAPRSKGLAYWLARYEVMVGHYAAASEAIGNAQDYPPVRQTIIPMLQPESADAPWLSWPCNFYTYRYTLAANGELLGMQATLAALSNNPEVVQTWLALGIPQSVLDQLLKERAVDAGTAISALLLWNQANLDMARNKYASAARNYEECQRVIVAYFAARYPDFEIPVPSAPDESNTDPAPAHQLDSALEALASGLIRYDPRTRQIWTFFRERYMTVTLEELHTHDWRRPKVVPLAYEFAKPLPDYGESTDFATAAGASTHPTEYSQEFAELG